ncbi:Intimal thickness related receptor IRP domain-containing protein [Entamoeba marina]
MFLWCLIAISNALLIHDFRNIHQKVSPLTSFLFNSDGLLEFDLHEQRRFVDIALAICPSEKIHNDMDCMDYNDSCDVKLLYENYQHGIRQSITKKGKYDIFLLHCNERTSIEIEYNLHLTNGDSELPLDSKHHCITFIIFLVTWGITFLGCLLLFIIQYKHVSILHIILMCCTFLQVIQFAFFVTYYVDYSQTGEPKEILRGSGIVFFILTETVFTVIVCLIFKGWKVVFDQMVLSQSKLFILFISLFSLLITMGLFFQPHFALIGFALVIISLTPLGFRSISFNIRLITHHVLSNQIGTDFHCLRERNETFSSWKLLIFLSVFRLLVAYIFFIAIWIMLRPRHGVLTPIEYDLNGVINRQFETEMKNEESNEPMQDVSSWIESNDIIVIGRLTSTDFKCIEISGVSLSTEYMEECQFHKT